jgi:hypothetical protein
LVPEFLTEYRNILHRILNTHLLGHKRSVFYSDTRTQEISHHDEAPSGAVGDGLKRRRRWAEEE